MIFDLTSIGYKNSVALISMLVSGLVDKALPTGRQCRLQRGTPHFEKDFMPKLVKRAQYATMCRDR